MKISAVNESVSLIANIGVIASIVFLGLEMQQNTAMMQSQTRNSIVENQLGLYELAIENAELHDIVDRLNSDLDVELTELRQIGFWTMSQFRMWENEFFQHEIGLFGSEEFEARVNWWRFVMGFDYALEQWQGSQEQFAPDFRIYMTELLGEIS